MLGAGEITLLLIVISGFFIPIIALVDIMKSSFRNNDKLLWVRFCISLWGGKPEFRNILIRIM